MAPLVPRMHVFEFADMPWFPPFLRAYMQAALTAAWTTHVPLLQASSPAQVVAHLLRTHLGPNLHSHIFIDFCAGGGGPTPSIERHLNTTTTKQQTNGNRASQEPLHFVLTDLHPHADMWAQAAAQAAAPGAISYVAEPVDAADVPRELIRRIFEMQDRGVVGFVACCLLGVGIMVLAPYYALLWGAPMALVFTYLLPILPAVLVFDGWMSCLRTRTPDEIEALLRTCGAKGGEEEIAKWEVMSGSEMFMWPVGYVDWVICVKRDGGKRD